MGPLQRASGPPPTAFSQDPPRIRSCERTSLVKNRMREICTSGSVRGEGGNILTYSAVLSPQRRETRGEGLVTTEVRDLAEEPQPARRVGVGQRGQEEPPEQARQHPHWQQKPGLQRTQRVPPASAGAGLSDMPPPGTIMWTCGWWVIAEPQLWSTAMAPMRAPRCLGSAAIVNNVSAAVRNKRS